MDLPIRIRTDAGAEPVVSIDGVAGAPGLHLSHWPGNRTPPQLKRDLSTEIALAFSALPAAERDALTAGCVALENNHYDTDGLCAMLAVARPELALPRSAALVDAAAAGDFFRVPNERAFIVDAVVTAWVDPERSPWRTRFAGLDARERYELCTHLGLEHLPRLLDGELEEWSELWTKPLAELRADRADLERAQLDDLVPLECAVWRAPAGEVSSRAGASACFDPGRHALYGSTDHDRILVLGPGPQGTTARLLLGTRSWFELASPAPQARPLLAPLAAALNAFEGSDPARDDVAWRHQDEAGASPELWFGRAGLPSFPEHAGDFLHPSGLEPTAIKAAVIDALRATWVFPEEEDDDGESAW